MFDFRRYIPAESDFESPTSPQSLSPGEDPIDNAVLYFPHGNIVCGHSCCECEIPIEPSVCHRLRHQPHWTCMAGYDMLHPTCMYGAWVSSYTCMVRLVLTAMWALSWRLDGLFRLWSCAGTSIWNIVWITNNPHIGWITAVGWSGIGAEAPLTRSKPRVKHTDNNGADGRPGGLPEAARWRPLAGGPPPKGGGQPRWEGLTVPIKGRRKLIVPNRRELTVDEISREEGPLAELSRGGRRAGWPFPSQIRSGQTVQCPMTTMSSKKWPSKIKEQPGGAWRLYQMASEAVSNVSSWLTAWWQTALRRSTWRLSFGVIVSVERVGPGNLLVNSRGEAVSKGGIWVVFGICVQFLVVRLDAWRPQPGRHQLCRHHISCHLTQQQGTPRWVETKSMPNCFSVFLEFQSLSFNRWVELGEDDQLALQPLVDDSAAAARRHADETGVGVEQGQVAQRATTQGGPAHNDRQRVSEAPAQQFGEQPWI